MNYCDQTTTKNEIRNKISTYNKNDCYHLQDKKISLAVESNKNDLQDFEAISELTACKNYYS